MKTTVQTSRGPVRFHSVGEPIVGIPAKTPNASPIAQHTPGPLPAHWSIKGQYMTSEDGCQRFIHDESGKVDRLRVATVLENHGYEDHARLWHLSPLQAAAPELLDALEVLTRTPAILAHLEAIDPMALRQARAAIAKAKGVQS